MTKPVLFIAAHGTRDADGESDARRFGERVQAALPDVSVHTSFIELSKPLLAETVADIAKEVGDSLAEGERGRVVTVPLMLASGGHAKDDIPDAVAEGRALNPSIDWAITDVLGPDERLAEAMVSRINTAGDAPAEETTVLLIGRGSSHVTSTANVAATARRVMHTGGYASVETAFIAVAKPSIEEGLERVARLVDSPDSPVVVASYLLFRGLMIQDIDARVRAWLEANPGRLTNVRVTETLGEDEGLVDVVLSRYREGCEALAAQAAERTTATTGGRIKPPQASDAGSPSAEAAAQRGTKDTSIVPFVPYLAGLRLKDRRVLVVGAGKVARRRVEGLLEVGADVTVVAPEAVPEIAAHAEAGELRWERRPFRPSDANDAWYVLACTDVPAVNESVAAAAEERHTFCSRADDGVASTAWTASVARYDNVAVGILANRRCRLSRDLRNEVQKLLESGTLGAQ